MSAPDPSFEKVQALVFDLMGTCTDWHTSIVSSMRSHPLPTPLMEGELPGLASQWRAGFFQFIFEKFEAGEDPPDIDVIHALVLQSLLKERGVDDKIWDANVRADLVSSWHFQQRESIGVAPQFPWPDTVEGIQQLRDRFMVVVLANGTTRLQLDLCRNLPFHTLFSSQLLQATKPNPEIYQKALGLLMVRPEQAAMVAAHAYDLRAAKKLGLRTVYIHRATEDLDEDMDKVRAEMDMFIDGTKPEGGLLELAHELRATQAEGEL